MDALDTQPSASDTVLRHMAPLFDGSGSVLLIALALFVLGLARVLARVAQLGMRFGIDRGRSAAHVASIMRVCGWLLLLVTSARWSLAQFPLATGLVLTVGLFALLAITGVFRDAAGTLLAQLRYRLGEGDHIRVGDIEGEIHDMHWDHLSLRGTDGQSLLVPGRMLLGGVLRVQPLHEGLLLERCVPCTLSADALGHIRDAIAICAYRIPDTPMTARKVDNGVTLSLYVWSRAALDLAEQQLVAQIREFAAQSAEAKDEQTSG